MNWTTRPMTPGDWAMVAFIYQEGIHSRMATFRTVMPTQEQWYASHINEGKLILENEAGQICGFTCLTQPRSSCAYTGFAELSIYMSNDCQGRGGGKFLLNALVDEAKKQGLWTLVAWIIEKNEPSIKLHESCGFREVGRHERAGKLDGEWQDIVIMEKSWIDNLIAIAQRGGVFMTWALREIKPEDWDTMASFYQEGIDSGIVNFRTEVPSREEWGAIHLPQCRLILEDENGETCGFAALAPAKRLKAYHGFAELTIYVGNKWRNQRAGSVLLWGLIEEARKAGFWTLVVSVFAQNLPSIHLFESQGFRRVGYHEKAAQQNGEWIDILVLEKNL